MTARAAIEGQTYTVVVSATPPDPPPIITSQAPLQATVGLSYQYAVQANDPAPDGQAVQFALGPAPAGMTISATGMIQWTPTAQQAGPQTVEVEAIDPDSGRIGSQQFTVSVARVNLPPQITSTPLTTITAGLTYHYDVQATDPDGDTLTYALDPATRRDDHRRPGPDHLARRHPRHRHPPPDRDGDRQPGGLGHAALRPECRGRHPAAPGPALVTPNPVQLGAPLTVLLAATDNVGVTSLVLTLDGTPVPIDAAGRATLYSTAGGTYDVVATATDAAGNTGPADVQLVVLAPDAQAPVVAITAPAESDIITAPVDVIGTASDANLLSYTLDVAPVGGRRLPRRSPAARRP